MPPKNVNKPKAKRVHLTVNQKLELVRKLESGKSVAYVCEEYGIKKQTVSDIKKQKPKLEAYVAKFDVAGKGGSGRKHMKECGIVELDAAVYKWYVQQRACGVAVRGVELAASAAKLASHLGFNDFKASDGWLWRFRKRHGIRNLSITGETESADLENIGPFRDQMMAYIRQNGLSMSQVYNLDETGVMWRAMPRNTQASKRDKTVKGRKLDKARLSVLCGCNASGTHRLKLAVTGKAKKPRALKNIMDKLPVHYYDSAKAWFTQWIINDYFKHHLVPEIKKHQERVLRIRPEDVRALVLLDNAPGHPSSDVLQSADGKITTMFLPANTTSVIQPMDQGVISAFKRRYQRKYLNEVLAVIETEADEVEDTRGKRTLENIKLYNIRSAIYNMAEAWEEMNHATFTNAWKKLLNGDEEYSINFEGFEANDFHTLLSRAGETEVTVDDIHDWIEENEATDGNEILSDEQIVAAVTGVQSESGSDSEDSDAGEDRSTVRMNFIRECADHLIRFVQESSRDEIQDHYDQLRILRSKIICMQHETGRQARIEDYFAPRTDLQPDSPAQPELPDSPDPVASPSSDSPDSPLPLLDSSMDAE